MEITKECPDIAAKFDAITYTAATTTGIVHKVECECVDGVYACEDIITVNGGDPIITPTTGDDKGACANAWAIQQD